MSILPGVKERGWLTGGARVEGPGYFFRPAVLDGGRRRGDRFARGDFRPGGRDLCLPRTRRSAIRRANNSPYGLAASVWTQDLSLAHEVARRLQVGCVWTNCYSRFDAAAPWGGVKASGYGTGIGHHAIEEYTMPKAVWIDTRTGPAVAGLTDA